jgi:hypothetical protein
MAEASRFRRRSRSASDGAEAGVDDSAGVFEVEGSLDIALTVKQLFGPDTFDQRWRRARPGLTPIPFPSLANPGQPMAATLRSLKRPLRTNYHLHPQLDISRCAHRASLWREGTILCRPLSTHQLPPTKSPRARVVSARELYAQRNRSLFMYTSAVVSARFVSRRAILYLELGIRR